MRRITTTDEELLLEISPCDEDEVDVFTSGDCWRLAYELHSRGVGKLIGVAEAEDADIWCHMAVKLPDGRYLDAHGIQSREQLLARWSGFVFRGRSVIANYDLTDPTRWEELTQDQEPNFSSQEDVVAVADMLIKWLEGL